MLGHRLGDAADMLGPTPMVRIAIVARGSLLAVFASPTTARAHAGAHEVMMCSATCRRPCQCFVPKVRKQVRIIAGSLLASAELISSATSTNHTEAHPGGFGLLRHITRGRAVSAAHVVGIATSATSPTTSAPAPASAPAQIRWWS